MPSTKEIEHRVQAFREMFRHQGLRITPQRTEVFREVARTDEHPDAYVILKRVCRRISNISLDTVYRILYLLEDQGLISRVQISSDRQRFDGNTDKHHHFVCTECGFVRDFQCEAFDSLTAPDEARRFGAPKTVHVAVRGVCEACLGKAEA